jgi:hypothetical protein
MINIIEVRIWCWMKRKESGSSKGKRSVVGDLVPIFLSGFLPGSFALPDLGIQRSYYYLGTTYY